MTRYFSCLRFTKSGKTPFTILKVMTAMAFISPSAGVIAEELARPSFLADAKVLTVCNQPAFPPLSYLKHPGDDMPIGSDIDLLGAMAEQWNVELRLVLTGDFAGLLPGLESKRCDMVMSGILVTPERQQKFDAVAYMKTSTLLLVSANNEQIHTLEDMSDKVLAIEAGTVLDRAATDANKKLIAEGKPAMRIQTYPRAQDCIEQILIGRADAALVQDTEAAFRDAQVSGRLKVAFTLPEGQNFGIYIRKAPGDAAAIRAAIDNLRASGFMAELPAKWHLPADAIHTAP